MIELNLLPDELKIKKTKAIEFAKLPIIPVSLGVLCVLIIMHTLLIFTVKINKTSLTKLKKEWESFSPKRNQMDKLKNRVKDINAKVKAIEELTQKRILWAKRLNCLSDSIHPNIWLSSLYYDKKSAIPTLGLEGFATGTEEDVGRFMDTLENSKEFFSGLQSIELGFTKRSLIDKQEVTNFRLICAFKERKKD
ncbi:MAG: hypothetical protein KAU58_01690 [Candidatus Omnitrophica bacterium]|nr:hypothetical protein [Candidatus Omnitrophota bacterium]